MCSGEINDFHLCVLDTVHDYVMAELRRPAKPFAVYQTQLYDRREIPIVCSKVAAKVEG